MRFLMLLGIVLMFMLSPEIEAKKKKKKRKKYSGTHLKYKKETTVEFSEVELEGAFQKPEGYYSLKAKSSKFDDLIEPKENFLDELKSSVFHIDEE